MKRLLMLIPAALLLRTVPLAAQPCDCEWPTDVIILHVNDMHGKIGNLAKLAYLADSLKHTCKRLFIVSAGGSFAAVPGNDPQADPGLSVVDLMNRCGFDASAIGDRETGLGQEVLNRRFRQARFPFVSCNAGAGNAVPKQPKAFVRKRAAKGNRILFLGVTGAGTSLPEGLNIGDPVTEAMKYAGMKDRNVLVALSSLGPEGDMELARRMPQLDLIIGGNSAAAPDSAIVENGVLVTRAGSDLESIGKIFIRLAKGRVIYRSGETIPMDSLTRTDPRVQAVVSRYLQEEKPATNANGIMKP